MQKPFTYTAFTLPVCLGKETVDYNDYLVSALSFSVDNKTMKINLKRLRKQEMFMRMRSDEACETKLDFEDISFNSRNQICSYYESKFDDDADPVRINYLQFV
jgi:hypothetical protein